MPIFFDRVLGLAQAGGVDDVQGHALDLDRFAHRIARRAGDLGDDGGLESGQLIEQARLADVRLTDQHDRQPFAQQRALACLCAHGLQARFEPVEPAKRVGLLEKIDLLFGKIQRRLDQHAQADQAFDEFGNARRKRAG